MPILDVQPVLGDGESIAPLLAQGIADAAARVFGSAPGRVWVRVTPLPSSHYAENDSAPDATPRPVFVTVLHAHPPEQEARASEAAALTLALAAVMGRAPELVHVQYAPAAAGRQAFGGTLVP